MRPSGPCASRSPGSVKIRAPGSARRAVSGGLERIGHEHLVEARQAPQRRTVILPRESSEPHDAQPERSHCSQFRGVELEDVWATPHRSRGFGGTPPKVAPKSDPSKTYPAARRASGRCTKWKVRCPNG